MKKRILSLILAVCLMVAVLPFAAPQQAEAASYNASAAVSYSESHWNDGVGVCDQFVKACLKAGGITITAGGVGAVYNALKSYGTPYLLTKSGQKILQSANSGKVSVGDIIFFHCSTCGGFVHTGICNKIKSDEVVINQHNPAKHDLSYLATYWHKTSSGAKHTGSVISVYSMHMNGGGTTPTPTSPPTYATLSVNKTEYAQNEAVIFTSRSDGNLNTLWIYCPDGSTLTYQNIPATFQLEFGMLGNFQALVEAWNGAGSKQSQRVSFFVGPPTSVTLSLDKSKYEVNETITFTSSSNGTINNLWIYYPDGSSKVIEKVPAIYKMTLHTPGQYQALVQTWNGIGPNATNRIPFEVVDSSSSVPSKTPEPSRNPTTSDISPEPAPAADAPAIHFPAVNFYTQGQFTDVPANQWYTNNVGSVFETGLMVGSSASTFSPFADVTVAEAVTMAARVHSIYTTGSESFTRTGNTWYQTYLDYAYQNGIITAKYYNGDVTKKATRAQFAEIFAASMPDAGLTAVNTVSNNAIPDVPSASAYAAYVYKLYRAGILAGGDAKGTFSPETFITRAEAAAIVSRLGDTDLRVRFTLK